ncbi:MAG TPA: hypothetical protein VKX46_18955, partial [Ktedonobacteraceae bacterium]|nr:hypothetical protein [Ktedonobacteraceae bacterium]
EGENGGHPAPPAMGLRPPAPPAELFRVFMPFLKGKHHQVEHVKEGKWVGIVRRKTRLHCRER